VNCHCEFNVFYNAENRSEADRVKRLSAIAIRSLISHGAFFSRPYGSNVEVIMNRDAESVNALRKIKEITDPQNIMNPGKLCF
jgi:FAD/FMN-containing dehydrogenase